MMTEKVKVNQTVADWIEEQRKLTGNDKLWLLYEVIGKRINSDFENNNIDTVTLAKAINFGYEVIYDFKVGDIVLRSSELINITESDVERFNKYKEEFTLICKAENREDLKEASE